MGKKQEYKKTPQKKTLGKTSFQSIESGAGERFLPLDRMARARIKAAFVSQTPVSALHYNTHTVVCSMSSAYGLTHDAMLSHVVSLLTTRYVIA